MKHFHYLEQAWQGQTKAVAVSQGADALTDKLKIALPPILILISLVLLVTVPFTQGHKTVRLRVGDGIARVFETEASTVGAFLAERQVDLHSGDVVVPGLDSQIGDGMAVEVDPVRHFRVSVDGQVFDLTSSAETPKDVFESLGCGWSPHDSISVQGVVVAAKPPVGASPSSIPLREVSVTSRGGRAVPDHSNFTIQSPLTEIIASTWPQGGGGGDIPDTINITLDRAKTLYVNDGGDSATIDSTADTVGRALLAEGIPVYLYDQVTPPTDSRTQDGMTLTINRAREVTVYDGDQTAIGYIHARTVKDALKEMGLTYSADDLLDPPASSPITDAIAIRRAQPVKLLADGEVSSFSSTAENVGAMLAGRGVQLGNMDIVTPTLETPLAAGMVVQVVRVAERIEQVEESVPFGQVEKPDGDTFEGKSWVQPGKPGTKLVSYRVILHDGAEVSRQAVDEEVVTAPVDEIKYVGTKKSDVVDTAGAPVAYSRAITVWATSYFPRTCGKAPGSPGYGITATGRRATRGIVAVDPRVIPFHTRMYIPGYGYGVAEDTGGMIRGNHVDLCFDDSDWGTMQWGARWVTIYILD
ncbi:MAG: ubiquitin-like domain-containing protein [Chloroflexi bacterium]|nr:ubiquitin-like domain-containing protein [Chloroflexota bacterium]